MKNGEKDNFPWTQYWALIGAFWGVVLGVAYNHDGTLGEFIKDYGSGIGGLAAFWGVMVALIIAQVQIQHTNSIETEKRRVSTLAVAYRLKALLDELELSMSIAASRITHILSNQQNKWTVVSDFPLLTDANGTDVVQKLKQAKPGFEKEQERELMELAAELSIEEPHAHKWAWRLTTCLKGWALFMDDVDEDDQIYVGYVLETVHDAVHCYFNLQFWLLENFSVERDSDRQTRGVRIRENGWPLSQEYYFLACKNPPESWGKLKPAAQKAWEEHGGQGDVPTTTD